MVGNTLDKYLMAICMVMANFRVKMVFATKVDLLTTSFMGQATVCGQTAHSTWVSGHKALCKAMGILLKRISQLNTWAILLQA